MRRLELAAQRFGRLLVKRFVGMARDGRSTWLCECDCGGSIVARGNHLKNADTRSCGCVLREHAIENATQIIKTHGDTCGPKGNQSRTSEYMTWMGMKERCRNPNTKHFKNYGGRGIKVCDQWMESFASFLADVGRRPSPKHSIDRINNAGNYEPGNVRWATRGEQNKNKRPSIPKGTKRKQRHERPEDKRPPA